MMRGPRVAHASHTTWTSGAASSISSRLTSTTSFYLDLVHKQKQVHVSFCNHNLYKSSVSTKSSACGVSAIATGFSWSSICPRAVLSCIHTVMTWSADSSIATMSTVTTIPASRIDFKLIDRTHLEHLIERLIVHSPCHLNRSRVSSYSC